MNEIDWNHLIAEERCEDNAPVITSEDIQRQTEEYLSNRGEVKECLYGESPYTDEILVNCREQAKQFKHNHK